MGKLSMKSATKVDVASDAALTTKSAKKGRREAKDAMEQAVHKKGGSSLESIEQAVRTEPKKKKKGVDVASDAALTTKSAKKGKREAQDVIETPLILKKLKPKLALEQAFQKNNVDANTPTKKKKKGGSSSESIKKKKKGSIKKKKKGAVTGSYTPHSGGESNLNQGDVETVCLSGFDSCLHEVEYSGTLVFAIEYKDGILLGSDTSTFCKENGVVTRVTPKATKNIFTNIFTIGNMGFGGVGMIKTTHSMYGFLSSKIDSFEGKPLLDIGKEMVYHMNSMVSEELVGARFLLVRMRVANSPEIIYVTRDGVLDHSSKRCTPIGSGYMLVNQLCTAILAAYPTTNSLTLEDATTFVGMALKIVSVAEFYKCSEEVSRLKIVCISGGYGDLIKITPHSAEVELGKWSFPSYMNV